MEKIENFYPKIFNNLSSESHDQAVIYCMYSWKSHKQHEDIIKDIIKDILGYFKVLYLKKLKE